MKKIAVIILATLVFSPAYAHGFHVKHVKEYKIQQVKQESPSPWKAPKKRDDRLSYLEEEIKTLRHRVQRLEDQVDQLRYTRHGEDSSNRRQDWFCSIEAQNKAYHGTGPSKAQAKAEALAKCEKNHSSFWCSESDVKCEQ